jgi:hemolysin activation/secretion protein
MRLLKGYIVLLVSLSGTTIHAQTMPETAATLSGGQILPDANPKPSNLPILDAPAQTSSAPVASNAMETGTLIGGVNVEGTAELKASEFSGVVESFLGKSADGPALQQLARSVASRARERGYLFASAIVPEQEINFGIVRVRLDEGRIDEIRITGSKNGRLRRMLGTLAGSPAVRATLERQLLLAGDIPGITIKQTRFERDRGRGILIVDVIEDRAKGQIWADNFGSNAFGPVRARAQADLSSIIVEGDSLTTQLLGTPASPKELTYASARYALPVGDNGATLALSLGAGRTQIRDFSNTRNINGHSKYASLAATYPIVRSNSKSLWLAGEVAYLSVDQEALGDSLQSDTIVTASFSASGQVRLAGGRMNGGVGVVQGLGILGATGSADFLSSRLDGSGRFTKAYLWMQWTAPLGHDFSVRLAGTGQVTSRALLAAQELNLGGPGFGRGFNFSERFGDNGVAGVIELRRDFDAPLPLVRWAQVYGFADGAYVHNLNNGFGSGSLFSAGGGFRAGVGPTEVSVEAALPINVIRAESGDNDPRVNMSLGVRF